MKYLAIILLSFSLALPASAARQVSGSVPQTQPFLSPEQGVAPNYTGNISHQSPSSAVSPGAAGQPGSGIAQTEGPGSAAVAGGQSAAGAGNKPSPWLAIIILLLGGAGAAGFWIYSRKKRP